MNKTYNMNLGGMPFQIDDEAFEKLNAYLEAVKRKYSNVQGNEEIVEDIEARIAELFHEGLTSSSRKIVSLKDVDHAIEAMGRPEEFDQGFDDEGSTVAGTNPTGTYRTGKKLFRDPDNKVFGGVISGLSHYFGLESPTWIRIIWAALPVLDIVFGGISTGLVLLTYIVLWIAIPKAVTSSEKMEMRGEPVNLDNIAENVKKNFSQDEGSVSQNRTSFGDVLGSIVRVVAKILIAIALVLAGIIVVSLLLAAIAALIGIGAAGPVLSLTLFGNNWMGWLFIAGLLLMLFALPIFLITLFIKLLFKTKTNMPAIAFGTLGAFILGLILSTFSGVNFAKEFSNSSAVRETTILEPASELFLFGDNDSDWNDDEFTIGIDESLFKERVDLKIINTKDSLPSLIIKKKAKGRTHEAANKRANSITYTFDVNQNQLTFSDELAYEKDDLFRSQSVDAILRIPEGTTVHFDESLNGVLDEAEIHGKEYDPYSLIKKGSWKYIDFKFIPVDDEGNPIEEYDLEDEDAEYRWEDGEGYLDFNDKTDHMNINLFGKEVFQLDVTERDIDGEPKRINIKIGDKEAIQIEVDEEGKVIEVD